MVESALNGKAQRSSGQVWAWLLALAEPALLAVLLCYLLYEFVLSHVEGDQAYLLYAAQQMLHGVQLDGPMLIETNPPLIVWFSLIPAELGRLLHVNAVVALRVVVLGILASSAAWGYRLMRLSDVAATFGRRWARVLWVLTFVFITVTQPAEFGQREQLLLALFLPYLLAVGSRVVERLSMGERVALGACAGLAVCFKPQHLLTIICLELFLALYLRTLKRLWSVELISAIVVGVLYVAAVYVFTPAYLLVITPLLRDTYWALGEYSFVQMALQVGRLLTLISLATAACWLALRRRLALPQTEGAMLAASMGAVLAYFQQHTGWYHQRFAAIALFEIACVWMAADVLRRRLQTSRDVRQLSTFAWVSLPLLGLLLFGLVWLKKRHAPPSPDDMQAELLRLPAHTTVYAFSVGMNAFPALMERDLYWGSRFAHLWMVPAIRANEAATSAIPPTHILSTNRLAELAYLQRRETTEDLQRTRPKVIFLERCTAEHPCASYRAPFNAVQWFSQDEAFAAVWSHYHFFKPVQDFDEYLRDDAADPAM